MKAFFKTLLIIIGVVGVLISTLIIYLIVSVGSLTTKPLVTIEQGSVLHITLNESVVESNDGRNMFLFDPNTFEITEPIALLRYIMAINSAATDPRISAILLEPSLFSTLNLSQLYEIKYALNEFKKSGKEIICYAESFTQSNYFAATVANKIFLPPSGSLEWVGMSMQTPFFKDALTRLGIEAQVVRHGKYKSAVEPFTQTKMSENSRHQYKELLFSFWNYTTTTTAIERGIQSDKMADYAANLSVDGVENSLKLQFVDSLLYRDQVLGYIGSTIVDSDEVNLVKLEDYVASLRKYEMQNSPNQIGIIYIDGELMSGESNDMYVGSTTVCKMLEQARKDEKIKSVVLRVNSPGGSALAADMMWREVELLQQSKPVVALFGAYAASGGYYISAPADCIVATPYSLTGSIGVFGLTFNAEKGLKSKLGITFDGVQSSADANINSMVSPLSKKQYSYLEKGVESVYTQFVSKVAKGRNLSWQEVDSIGQGRVWSGLMGAENGLVDKIGSFDVAFGLAAQKSGVTNNFDIKVIRDESDPLTQLYEAFSSVSLSLFGSNEIREAKKIESRVRNMAGVKNIQTLMPYTINIK